MHTPAPPDNLFASAKTSLETLRVSLQSELPAYSPEPGAKLMRLIAVWHQSLLHRLCDLADASLSLFEQGRLVPACTLTRSFGETFAQLYYFQKKVGAARSKQDLDTLTDFVGRGAWGSKDGSTKQEALQILTAVDHVETEFTGFRGEYDHLCEYAHPNMKGCLAAYSNIQLPAYHVDFGKNPQQLPLEPFGLGALDIWLEMAVGIQERFATAHESLQKVVKENANTVFVD